MQQSANPCHVSRRRRTVDIYHDVSSPFAVYISEFALWIHGSSSKSIQIVCDDVVNYTFNYSSQLAFWTVGALVFSSPFAFFGEYKFCFFFQLLWGGSGWRFERSVDNDNITQAGKRKRFLSDWLLSILERSLWNSVVVLLRVLIVASYTPRYSRCSRETKWWYEFEIPSRWLPRIARYIYRMLRHKITVTLFCFSID